MNIKDVLLQVANDINSNRPGARQQPTVAPTGNDAIIFQATGMTGAQMALQNAQKTYVEMCQKMNLVPNGAIMNNKSSLTRAIQTLSKRSRDNRPPSEKQISYYKRLIDAVNRANLKTVAGELIRLVDESNTLTFKEITAEIDGLIGFCKANNVVELANDNMLKEVVEMYYYPGAPFYMISDSFYKDTEHGRCLVDIEEFVNVLAEDGYVDRVGNFLKEARSGFNEFKRTRPSEGMLNLLNNLQRATGGEEFTILELDKNSASKLIDQLNLEQSRVVSGQNAPMPNHFKENVHLDEEEKSFEDAVISLCHSLYASIGLCGRDIIEDVDGKNAISLAKEFVGLIVEEHGPEKAYDFYATAFTDEECNAMGLYDPNAEKEEEVVPQEEFTPAQKRAMAIAKRFAGQGQPTGNAGFGL